MKTTLYSLTLLTFVIFGFVPNSFAQEYIVRQIYFYPSDQVPPQDIDATLDKVMEDVQKFYADEMERHGFGRKTFRLETDAAGNQVRQHIRGKYTNADYWINYTHLPSYEDVDIWEQRFINLVVFDINKPIPISSLGSSTGIAGVNLVGGHGGHAHIYLYNFDEGNFDDFRTPDYRTLFKTVAHELGHTFGLSHDFRDDWDIMSYGAGIFSTQYRLSYGAAEWLDVTHYFSTTPSPVEQRPTAIEMLPPTFISPPNTIRLRFSISHTERIHQVQLLTNSLIDHKSIKGDTNTVEFVTDKLPLENIEVRIYVIDEHGNFGAARFRVDITTLVPDSESVSIPDTNLAAAIRESLDLAPGSTITRLHMASLQKLIARDKQITDLTGLEYATNLVDLNLYRNEITDVSPLAELPQLRVLTLGDNNISDISLLTRFTNLTELDLGYNDISDISPLTELPQLRDLRLGGNNISDISPIAGLTNLGWLALGNNDISDISPLAKLTQLRVLSLGGNNISDISLLTRFTNLIWLHLYGNDISDISPIAELTQLEILWLGGKFSSWRQGNNISDISLLTRLTNLTELSLDYNNISDISPLTRLTNLIRLHLNHNDISDISLLTRFTNLTELDLGYNNISDISPLAGLTNLQELYLAGNPIKNRKPLLELLRKNPDMEIYLKDRETPLPVTLSHFRAELTEAGVLLKWTTESELDNAGFYIYRSETKDGEFKVANPTMIQGSGTTSERNEYTWTDTTAKPNTVYYYRIEDVSHAGVREQLATVRLRGLVSATGKLITRWGDLKHNQKF